MFASLTAVAALLGAVVGALAFLNTFTEQRNLRTRLRKDVDLWKDLTDHPAAQHRLEEVIHRQVNELATVTLHQRSLARQRLALWLAALAAVSLVASFGTFTSEPSLVRQLLIWPLTTAAGVWALTSCLDGIRHRQAEDKAAKVERETRELAAQSAASERRPGGGASSVRQGD